MAMSEQVTGEQPARGHWVDTVLRPVLVAAMLACLAAPAVELLEQLQPGWNGSFLLGFSFLANLEGILSERMLARRRISGWSYAASRAAEALVLLLLLKLASYLSLGWGQLEVDARRWVVAPKEFVSPEDFFAGLLFVMIWLVSISLSRLLNQLDVIEDKPPPDKNSTEYYLWLTQPTLFNDRHQALEQLGELFFLGGVLLLGGLAMLWFVSRGPLPVITSLVYFALGIIPLSQAQFSVLQAGWQIQQIEVQPNIARRWLIWVAILAGVTLAVIILPVIIRWPARARWGAVTGGPHFDAAPGGHRLPGGDAPVVDHSRGRSSRPQFIAASGDRDRGSGGAQVAADPAVGAVLDHHPDRRLCGDPLCAGTAGP